MTHRLQKSVTVITGADLAPAVYKGRLALSIVEVAAALGISRTSTYVLINDGRLDRRKVGRRTLITAASVNRLLQEAGDDA